MTEPVTNLQGDYAGSCVVCLTGTDTGMAFEGPAEFLTAGLIILNIPEETCHQMVLDFFERAGAEQGKVYAGVHRMPVRACASCVGKAQAKLPEPLLVVGGSGIPVVFAPELDD